MLLVGKECVTVTKDSTAANISEITCIGCNICVKVSTTKNQQNNNNNTNDKIMIMITNDDNKYKKNIKKQYYF